MSVQIIPPSEKQLDYFHNLAEKLGIQNPEVPKSKAAANMKISEYKFQYTTRELAALSSRVGVQPAEFKAAAIADSIDRKILSHPAMENAGISRIHEAGVDGDDPEVAAKQEQLRTRFEIPFRQKHIDFELARLGLMEQQKITGETANLADASASYEERFKTMLSELQRIRSLPTRRQMSAIKRHAERTGNTFTLPATRKQAGQMVKDMKDAFESNKRAAASGNIPGFSEGPLPEANDGLTIRQEAALSGGASGTAYQPEEYQRTSTPYWQDDDAATANMSPQEREAFRAKQAKDAISDTKLDALRAQVIDEMDPSLVNSQLGNAQRWAETSGLDTSDLTFNENGAVQLENTEDAVAFIDRLANARAYAGQAASTSAPSAETPVAQRGNWGDDQEVVPPTAKQLDYFTDLCKESGVRIREAGEAAIPIEGVRIYQDSIAMPQTKQEAIAAIELVKERIESTTQSAQTANAIKGMDQSEADEISRALRPDERQVFELHFRAGADRADVAKQLEMSPQTYAKVERGVLNKVSRLTKQRSAAATSGASTSASLSAQATAALPAM